MELVDNDGEVLPVPRRFEGVVRWLVTEAARHFEDSDQTGKIIVHLGRGKAPPKAILEQHHSL